MLKQMNLRQTAICCQAISTTGQVHTTHALAAKDACGAGGVPGFHMSRHTAGSTRRRARHAGRLLCYLIRQGGSGALGAFCRGSSPLTVIVAASFLGLGGCSEAPPDLPKLALNVVELPGVASGRVSWQPWARRDSANAEGRSILLFLYSERSYWSRDLVRRCFEDPEIGQQVTYGTYPVRVDIDLRPDLAARYGMGGWPTIAFLEPGDALISGGAGLDPEDLIDLLRRVRVHIEYEDRREDLRTAGRRLNAYLAHTTPDRGPAPLSWDLVDRIADSVRVAVSRGGWVSPESLVLLAERSRGADAQANRFASEEALARIAAGLGKQAHGLYRVPLVPDGQIASEDANLAMNAVVLAALSRCAVLLGDAEMRLAAADLANALRSALYLPDSGLFAAGLMYPVTTGSDRLQRDASILSGWNALAVSAFAACYSATGNASCLSTSERVMRALQGRFVSPGGDVKRSGGSGGDGPTFLEDHALVARAALDLSDASGDRTYLEFARQMTDGLLRRFQAPDGSLWDRYPEPATPHRPSLDGTVPSAAGVSIQVLVRLWTKSGNPGYRDAALRALEAHTGPAIDQAARLGAMGMGLMTLMRAQGEEREEAIDG